MARRIGASWFTTAIEVSDSLSDNLYGYYSVDGGPDIQITPKVALEQYSSSTSPEGDVVPLYRGAYNPVIPEGAVGLSVVLKIYDPDKPIDYLEYDSIEVCTDEATAAVISPASASIRTGGTRQFSASFVAADGLPTTNHDDEIWSASASGATEGSIDINTGLFTAGTAAGGPYAVGVTAGAVVATPANVTVVRVPTNVRSGVAVGVGVGISL